MNTLLEALRESAMKEDATTGTPAANAQQSRTCEEMREPCTLADNDAPKTKPETCRFTIPLSGTPTIPDVSQYDRVYHGDKKVLASWARGGFFIFETQPHGKTSLWIAGRNILGVKQLFHAHTGTPESCLRAAHEIIHEDW